MPPPLGCAESVRAVTLPPLETPAAWVVEESSWTFVDTVATMAELAARPVPSVTLFAAVIVPEPEKEPPRETLPAVEVIVTPGEMRPALRRTTSPEAEKLEPEATAIAFVAAEAGPTARS